MKGKYSSKWNVEFSVDKERRQYSNRKNSQFGEVKCIFGKAILIEIR